MARLAGLVGVSSGASSGPDRYSQASIITTRVSRCARIPKGVPTVG